MKSRLIGILINILVFLLGLVSLLSPFIFPWAKNPNAQTATFPIIVSLIIILCVGIILFEAQSSIVDIKKIALLGVLVAINAGIRFLENAIPGPAGFSPTFFLVIVAGYFFGSRMGFLMGATTMLVSAIITGGVGPWLPGQMITTGWVGQSAGLVRFLLSKTGQQNSIVEIISLAIFAAFWGLLYGLIMNLWFWPFLGGFPGQIYSLFVSNQENIQRYMLYYLSTSLVWDITRAIGNVLMVIVMTKPVLKILERFSRRFSFTRMGTD
jgi:energy-coupling factor transport system substrate-specific component